MYFSTQGLRPKLNDSSDLSKCHTSMVCVNPSSSAQQENGPALPLGAGWPVRCLQHSVMTEAEEYADAVDRT